MFEQMQMVDVRLTPAEFDALKAFLGRVAVSITEAPAMNQIALRLQEGLQRFQAEAAQPAPPTIEV